MFQRTERESWVSILPSISSEEAVEVTRVKLKAEPTFPFKGLRRQAHTAERVQTQDPRVKSLLFSLKTLGTLKQKSACGSSVSWVWQLFIVQHYKNLLDRHQNSSALWDSPIPKQYGFLELWASRVCSPFLGGVGCYTRSGLFCYTRPSDILGCMWVFGKGTRCPVAVSHVWLSLGLWKSWIRKNRERKLSADGFEKPLLLHAMLQIAT